MSEFADSQVEQLRARVDALSEDLRIYARECVALHDVQHDKATLVKPELGGSIILWAASEIKALRAVSGSEIAAVCRDLRIMSELEEAGLSDFNKSRLRRAADLVEQLSALLAYQP